MTSVWYKVVPTADADFEFVGGCVYSGTALENLTHEGEFHVVMPVKAGTSYFLRAGAQCCDGGRFQDVSIREVVPPTVGVTLDRSGAVTRSGDATVSGSYVCRDPSSVGSNARLQARVTQAVGRLGRAEGTVTLPMTCDGANRPWVATVSSTTAVPFWPGSAGVDGDVSVSYRYPISSPIAGTVTLKAQK